MPWFPPHVPVGARRRQSGPGLGRAAPERRGRATRPHRGTHHRPQLLGAGAGATIWNRARTSRTACRGYVRNGSVCHLDVHVGGVDAMVVGSDLYHVVVRIRKLGQGRLEGHPGRVRGPGRIRARAAPGAAARSRPARASSPIPDRGRNPARLPSLATVPTGR